MISKKQSSLSSLDHRDQRTIEKYLEKYSAPESRWPAVQLETISEKRWDYVVTIPACGEDEYLPAALNSIADCQAVAQHARVLCIVVLNGNEARESEFRLANNKMRDWFSTYCTIVASGLNPKYTCPQSLLQWKGIEILLVDRSQADWLIPADQGVGLVRKIGADIALVLIAAGNIKSPWIHTTDADARVPDDYFIRLNKPPETGDNFSRITSCYIYPYQHIPDAGMTRQEHDRYWPAVSEYELWLRYYVAGLKWAGSAYAYPSVGSLLACDFLAYARIRGFPKRMAGEDFYFQNKLAKVGAMITLRGEPIQLLTRASTRVPFGTGQGTIRIEQLNESGSVYEVYHPAVFNFLKGFLSAAQHWLNNTEVDYKKRKIVFFASVEKYLPSTKKSNFADRIWLQELLSDIDLFNNLCAAEKRSKSINGAVHQFDDWFDGFRTLKLIHRLRDDLYGSVPLLDALQSAEFLQKPALNNGVSPNRAWLDIFRT